MKKTILTLLMALASTIALSAEDAAKPQEPKKSFSIDGALGLSFGLFSSLNNTAFGDLSALATIASVRGGGDADLLYKVNDFVSAGPAVGIYALQYTVSGGNTYTFFDLPLRVVAKIGMKEAFIQPFLGYYITSVGFPFPGFEAGARGVLGSFFVEASYVLGNPNWKHIAIGVVAADLFTF